MNDTLRGKCIRTSSHRVFIGLFLRPQRNTKERNLFHLDGWAAASTETKERTEMRETKSFGLRPMLMSCLTVLAAAGVISPFS